MNKKAYYVVMCRVFANSAINTDGKIHDKIMIFDFAEALERNWIDENGERVWVLDPDYEGRCITFVYGFDNLTEAVNFYEALSHNELGIKTVEK